MGYYLNLYNTWSSYTPEEEGVLIACASINGNTLKAAKELAKLLEEKGFPKVVVCDLAREDMAEAIEDAFRYSHLVLASSTYNMDVFPFMHQFLHGLTERNYQKRTVGLMENGTWAPNAAKVMAKALENPLT